MFLALFLISAVYNTAFAEPENYCHDKESWKQWDALVVKNPIDMGIQTLHALRIGLCAKVDGGEITLEQATEIFESAREAMIHNRKESKNRDRNRQKLQIKPPSAFLALRYMPHISKQSDQPFL